MLAPLAEALWVIAARYRTARAWRAFDAAAVVDEGCLLGPAAWCVNAGPRERMRVGAQTVCRGILRREHFGDGRLTIGRNVYIGDDCIISCSDNIAIGDHTLLGHGVQVFDNDSHPTDRALRARDWHGVVRGSSRPDHAIHHAPISIAEGVWVGFGSTVLKGVSIGPGAVIAAGSIVTEDVAADTIVAGIPAKPIRLLDMGRVVS